MRKYVGLVTALMLTASVSEAAAQQTRLSPRDSIAVSVDGKEISVAWGSPSVRGREIFGGLVPWGEVWRTGANEATALRTETDLEIGGHLIPAGNYTLYTIPERESWTLIVNTQTDQWGTTYNASQDLVRVPMQVDALDTTVEQFAILLACELSEPCVDLANPAVKVEKIVLSMEWERTRARVSVVPREAEAPAGD